MAIGPDDGYLICLLSIHVPGVGELTAAAGTGRGQFTFIQKRPRSAASLGFSLFASTLLQDSSFKILYPTKWG